MNDESEICRRLRSEKIEPMGKHGDIESFIKINNLMDIEIVKIDKKYRRVENQSSEYSKHQRRLLEVHKITDRLAKQGINEKNEG